MPSPCPVPDEATGTVRGDGDAVPAAGRQQQWFLLLLISRACRAFQSQHQCWVLVQVPWMGTKSDGEMEPRVGTVIGYTSEALV